MISTDPSLRSRLKEADAQLKARRPQLAEQICADILAAAPALAEAHLIRARSCQMMGLHDRMLESVEVARAAEPSSLIAALMRIEALICLGEIRAGREAAQALKTGDGANDPVLLARIAELETQLGAHAVALETLRRAASLQPQNTAFAYNLASAEIANGELAAAEARLDALIACNAADYDAFYNRSTLRTQSHERNHIEELTSRLGATRDPRGEVALCYALAKEFEDLQDYEASFAYLKRGAEARSSLLQYRVETDIAAMEKIAATFDEGFFRAAQDSGDGEGAIFVLGLPRSGTTLVDRILSSHPDIESAGEINDLAYAITRHGAGAASKTDLIERSASMDFAAVGRQYMKALRERGAGARYVIDKTPLNYLYIGIIAKALPKATIIHVDRDAMDTGFAIYKTLFRMGYPFSYNLGSIGRYMRAKSALMEHWRGLLGERIVDISYEALIADQEGESRRLIAAAGAGWRDECLAFHQNKTPAATASAAQVRRPIYSSSVGKWKQYEHHLGELSKALQP
ncbi:sulfotransferase [Hyphococcus sp.]|jgi:hypothetical protein|uniref:sulfotransferase family protein n=1 Tax=Hyphococcus sp. TaxID=2038636 RepID=UPI003D0F04A2